MRRILYPLSLVVLFFVVLIATMGGQFAVFVDLPSLLIVLLFPLLYQAAMFGTGSFKSAFTAPFRDESRASELNFSLSFFSAFGKAIWLFALIASVMSIIAVLTDITDLTRIGIYAAITLLCLLYAAMINLMLIRPYISTIERRLGTAAA